MKTTKIIFATILLSLVSYVLHAQLINAVVGVTGTIIDSKTKETVNVDIKVYDSANQIVNRTNSNSADGYYYIAGLKPGNKYTVELSHKDYFKENYEINVVNSDKYLEISRDFLVRPLKENVALKIAVPPFELNKSKLRYGAALILEDITNTLKNNPNVYFTIVCYPDNNKDKAHNLTLTEARANSLKDYFAINGINPDRIDVKGNSTIDPEYPLPTEKAAKGKRYIGTNYVKVNKIK